MTAIFRWICTVLFCGTLLGACAGPAQFSRSGGSTIPALEALSLDFERTQFRRGTRVSGDVARRQQQLNLSTPTFGRFRNEATGPIPTEVRIDLTSISTTSRTVVMEGRVVLRDLAFGTTMATLDGFRANGRLPLVQRGGDVTGLVFRGVEAEILDWIGTLECNTRQRICGERTVPVSAEVAPEGADLALDDMVGRRPRGLRGLVGGGIDPDQVIAAAPMASEVPAASENTNQTSLGTTVAALGLLNRSGFWMQTPLVSSEVPGEVLEPISGRTLSLTLIPKDGPAGGGSQISLAALNALGQDVTALVTLEVFR